MTSKEKKSKEVVVIIGTSYAYLREHLSWLNKSDDSMFIYELASGSVEECVKYLKETGKKCVIPAFDANVITAAAINQRIGYPAPSLLSLVACHNKNLTRTLLGNFGWFYGFNLDQSIGCVLKNVKGYPCMLKSTMLAGGNSSFCCEDEAALCSNLETIRSDVIMRKQNMSSYSEAISVLKQSSQPELVEKCTQYMVEQHIDIGATGTYQYCMEGFISCDGKVIVYSLVEELFFKNGMNLGHVIPPVHFNGNFEPFEAFMESVGERLWDLGFQNQMFDIEFWQFPDGSFWITEVNPRMAAAYYDLYHLYSGNNCYEDVAHFVHLGLEPEKSPLSHLKHMWSTSKRNHTHSFMVGLTTRARGKVRDILDIDFLQDCISNYAGIVRVSKDDVLAEVHSTRYGRMLSSVHMKGSWNEIVTEAKRIKANFYKDKEQFYEACEYPDYFITEP